MLKVWRSEKTASGMANAMENIQIIAAVMQILALALEDCTVIGLTIALYLRDKEQEHPVKHKCHSDTVSAKEVLQYQWIL